MLMGMDLRNIPILFRIVGPVVLCTHSNCFLALSFDLCQDITLLLQEVLQNVVAPYVLFLGLTPSEG